MTHIQQEPNKPLPRTMGAIAVLLARRHPGSQRRRAESFGEEGPSLQMRTSVAIVLSLSATAGMIRLLMLEETQLWQLVLTGSAGGMLSGGVRWGWRGAGIGVLVGAVLGLVAPILYAPFWLVFTLPPYPKYDL